MPIYDIVVGSSAIIRFAGGRLRRPYRADVLAYDIVKCYLGSSDIIRFKKGLGVRTMLSRCASIMS